MYFWPTVYAIWNYVLLQRYLSTYQCVLISNPVISLFLNHTQTAHHIPCIIIQNNLGLTIASLSKNVPLPPLVANVEAMATV